MAWTPDQLPDLSARTILVTGANSGIGWEAARLLARRGARVILACRSPDRAAAACARLLAELPTARLEQVQLDLGSLASIRTCAAEVEARFGRLDVLVNNAGIMAVPFARTADGFEVQVGTNHLGHFALSALLGSALARSEAPRVVTVSSTTHWAGRVDIDALVEPRQYSKWGAYAASKLANLLFTMELHRRAGAAGSPLCAVACHPGYAATNLQGVGPSQEGARLAGWVMAAGNALFAQSAERGAWPTVHAAAGDVVSGKYYGPAYGLWGYPREDVMSAAARDSAVAERLWVASERLTGVRWFS
jgi:NAD(P)-dependent dehydrogenase (short-subunit alcohol dehydrogenase family)